MPLTPQQTQTRSAAQAWALGTHEGCSRYLQLRDLPPGKLYGATIAPEGSLMVALRDVPGTIHALQLLRPSSAKCLCPVSYYPRVAPIEGNFAWIDGLDGAPVTLLCEGFATGATLREATGLPVAVTIFSSNLGPVAQALLAANPGTRLLVCGQAGMPGKCNTSADAAQAAAQACPLGSASWVIPEFPLPPLRRFGDTCFNDLHSLRGLDEVLTQVMRAVEELLSPQNGNGPSSESARTP